GIADQVVAGGVQVPGVNLWVEGERAARVPIDALGQGLSPYPFALVYPQDAHEQLLIERLAALGVSVERSTELVAFEEQEGGVRATIARPDGSTEVAGAAFLAGCDGASSTVRESLGVDFPGGTYAGLFFVADVVAHGPATDDEIHVDFEEADFAIVFPLQGEGRVRLVGVVREDFGDELDYDDVSGRAIENLKLDVERVNWFSTYRVHHRVASHFAAGRAFLLGDAAHIHSPVGGQGMNTGIGDAVNLAWKLSAVVKGRAPESLLDTYEPERIAFARRLVATTDRMFTFVTRRGRVARIVRTRLVPWIAPHLFRLPGMQRFFFRTVSQIGIEYHGSRLSAGEAGDVRGGDRLPWVETGTGEDNFAPLASMAWHAHVYGEARPELVGACRELGLPLHRFAWGAGIRRAGLGRGALYLIRPDGYVALADPRADPGSLRSYLADRGIEP
ncbi:MAG TPA: FAD-dependent monooxygenase, partial [Gemmatimonadota bacterium]|nr:FAD-dependent monooxygenase [Gemmatimonadota bacterium]